MPGRIAAGDSDGAELFVHAVGQTQGPRRQRALSQRAQDRRRIQGVARPGLWLLLDQAFADRQASPEWCEEFSDRASLDDQPLMQEMAV
jgi:hypothetical protein